MLILWYITKCYAYKSVLKKTELISKLINQKLYKKQINNMIVSMKIHFISVEHSVINWDLQVSSNKLIK